MRKARIAAEVVKVVDLEPIPLGDWSLSLRIEVLKEASGRYRPRLLRHEMQSLRPLGERKTWTKEVLVVDDTFHFDCEAIRAQSAKGVLDRVVELINAKLSK